MREADDPQVALEPTPAGSGTQATSPIAPVEQPPVAGTELELRFTGRGGEYFRVWIVNLFLSAITLGIYSAWAKVRKNRYFWQNTRLAGHVFDFHGRPWAILRGRILALALLAAYSWSFDFSAVAGWLTLAALLVLGPWLFVKAQVFKFGNTSHRGLRFGFTASARDGYRVVTPILVIWFSSTALAVLLRGAHGLVLAVGVSSVATLVLLPWMHHRLKAFQHGHLAYGDRRAQWTVATRSFYGIYAKAFVVALAASVAAGIVGLVLALPLIFLHYGGDELPSVLFAAIAFVIYLVTYAYCVARLQALVWSRTTLPGVTFTSTLAAWRYIRLVLRTGVLTVLTAGLYWPFAAMALARARVDAMRVHLAMPIADVAAATAVDASMAVGDAAADTFGIELGL